MTYCVLRRIDPAHSDFRTGSACTFLVLSWWLPWDLACFRPESRFLLFLLWLILFPEQSCHSKKSSIDKSSTRLQLPRFLGTHLPRRLQDQQSFDQHLALESPGKTPVCSALQLERNRESGSGPSLPAKSDFRVSCCGDDTGHPILASSQAACWHRNFITHSGRGPLFSLCRLSAWSHAIRGPESS